jgi:hypothetical protein
MGHPWTSPINIYIYGVFNGKKSSTNDYKCEIFHRHKNDFRRIKAAHPSKVWQLSMIENKHEKPLHNSPKSPKITLFCMSNNTNTSINNHRYINNHNIYIYTVYIYSMCTVQKKTSIPLLKPHHPGYSSHQLWLHTGQPPSAHCAPARSRPTHPALRRPCPPVGCEKKTKKQNGRWNFGEILGDLNTFTHLQWSKIVRYWVIWFN